MVGTDPDLHANDLPAALDAPIDCDQLAQLAVARRSAAPSRSTGEWHICGPLRANSTGERELCWSLKGRVVDPLLTMRS